MLVSYERLDWITNNMISLYTKTETMLRLELKPELIRELTEGQVLSFVVQEYRINNKHVDAHAVLAEIAGCSESHLANCLADRTALGMIGWGKIVAATKTNLFAEWSDMVWERFGLLKGRQ